MRKAGRKGGEVGCLGKKGRPAAVFLRAEPVAFFGLRRVLWMRPIGRRFAPQPVFMPLFVAQTAAGFD